jgi:hypothetical protein
MEKGVCRNYHGAGIGCEKKCDEGIVLRLLVGGDDSGWISRLPCRKENFTTVVCEKYTDPTDEEVAEFEAMIKLRMEMMMTVEPKVGEIKKAHKDKDASGKFDCPICKDGVIEWHLCGFNNHMRLFCSTKNCISFVE